jgi:hypothetical protein
MDTKRYVATEMPADTNSQQWLAAASAEGDDGGKPAKLENNVSALLFASVTLKRPIARSVKPAARHAMNSWSQRTELHLI